VRLRLKSALERALASRSISRFTRRSLNGQRLILAYHGVIPDGAEEAGERTLFITQRDFRAHLDMLAEFADVAALDVIDQEGDGRPRVAITLDDAYRGAVCEGVHELVQRSLPATIFVAPARLNDHVFWWDALARDGRLDPRVRRYALQELSGDDERVRNWAASLKLPLSDSLPSYARAATLGELKQAVRSPGITVGAHTWSHVNLSTLSLTDVIAEVSRPKAWLRREFPAKTVDWLAYPYGHDSVGAHGALLDSSYAAALKIDGGWHRVNEVARFARPRLNIPSGLSVTGLKARTLGALT
jgi:peptidoglycan/xylan/chitin deacetylase (PgdA/CDA1 family)